MLGVQSPVISLIQDLIKKSPGTISLGQGIVYYPPPRSALDKITPITSALDYHCYSEVDGIPQLKATISNKLAEDNNIHLHENRSLVVTAGSNMGFMNALMAITDPGDEIILLSPYYFNHEMAIKMLSCQPVAVKTDAI